MLCLVTKMVDFDFAWRAILPLRKENLTRSGGEIG
jgi:hypothetical protein